MLFSLQHLKYLAITLSVMSSLFMSVPLVDAQTVDYDQRCFTRQECTDARTDLIPVFIQDEREVANGFIQNELSSSNCAPLQQQSAGADVGFCLAGGTTETSVQINGQNRFDDIGDFIVTVFRFSFIAAIAFAVVMIIVSGLLWMTSAGNSSVIGDAKQRIGGALLGLLLLSMSYTILDTINPNLTTLRQPNVYLLRADVLEPITSEQLCDPDGNGPFGTCPDTQYCLPNVTVEAEDALDGACDQAIAGAILAPFLLVGGATVLPAAGTAVVSALQTGAGTVVSYIPIINGQAITLGSVASFGATGIKVGGSIIRGGVAAAGVAVTGAVTYEVVSLADQVSGFSTEARIQYQRFTQSRGICVDKAPGTLKKGDQCSAAPNAGVTCQTGLTCVPDTRISGIIGCFVPGAATGFCSEGTRNERCVDNTSCTTGFSCVEFDLSGGDVNDGKYCTDGGEGAYCIDDPSTLRFDGTFSDCQPGLSCVGERCVARPATMPFEPCTSSGACSNITGVHFEYGCWVSSSSCAIEGRSDVISSRVGVCLGKESIGGLGYTGGSNTDCERGEYMLEDGRCLSKAELFTAAAQAISDVSTSFEHGEGWSRSSCQRYLGYTNTEMEQLVGTLRSEGYRFPRR